MSAGDNPYASSYGGQMNVSASYGGAAPAGANWQPVVQQSGV